MATLGLFSPEFPSGILDANLNSIAATGALSVQFDLASALGETFPAELSEATIRTINAGFVERGLNLAALSGTYNMIDPDLQARASGEKGLTVWPLFGAWRPQAIFETAHTERAVSEVEQVTLETMPSPCRRVSVGRF